MKCHLEISQGMEAGESFSSAVRLRVQMCLNANVENETRVCNDAIFYLLSNKGDGFKGGIGWITISHFGSFVFSLFLFLKSTEFFLVDS